MGGCLLTTYFPTLSLGQQAVFLGCSDLQAGGFQLGKGLGKPGNVAFSLDASTPTPHSQPGQGKQLPPLVTLVKDHRLAREPEPAGGQVAGSRALR